MAQRIKFRRSSVAGRVPTTSSLSLGELAINTADGKLFFQRGDETIQSIFTTNTLITGSFQQSGSDSYFLSRLGIGTDNPLYDLHIVGTTNITGSLFATDINATNNITVVGTLSASDAYIDNWGSISSSLQSISQSAATIPTLQQVTDEGSVTVNNITITGSLNTLGNVSHDGDLTVTGVVTAQEFKTEFVSASIIYQSGSTKFGDTSDDNHDFTGSLNVEGGGTFDPTGATQVILKRYGDSVNANEFVTAKARGSKGAPSAVQNGDYLGGMEFHGYDGSAYVRSSFILPVVTGSIASGDVRSDIRFSTRQGIGGAFSYPMVITSDKKVGINTLVPSKELTVEGEISASGQVTANYFYGTTGGWFRGSQFLEAGNVHTLRVGYGSAGQFQLQTGNGAHDVLRATHTGLVGIGTTSPTEKLQVEGNVSSSDAYIDDWGSISASLASISGSAATIPSLQQVTDIGSTTTGDITVNGTGSFGRLVVDGTSNYDLTIRSQYLTGSVIESAREVFINSGRQMFFNTDTDGGATGDRFWTFGSSRTYNTSGRSYFIIGNDGGYPYLRLNNHDNNEKIRFASSGSSYINSGGNVGIGTTSPSQKLEVDGNLKITGSDQYIYGPSNTENIRFYTPGNNIILNAGSGIRFGADILLDGANKSISTNSGDTYFTFYNQTYDGFDRIIRQFEPIVKETSTEPAIISRADLEFRIDSNNDSTTSAFKITKDTGTELMRINEAGNVGIGTSTPGEILTISTPVATKAEIEVDSGADATLGLDKGASTRRAAIVYRTAGTDNWYVGTADSDVVGNGDDYFIGTTVGGTDAEFFISSSGNVGIGATSPTAKLYISGSSSDTAFRIAQPYTTDTNPDYIGEFTLANTTRGGLKVEGKGETTNNNAPLLLYGNDTAGGAGARVVIKGNTDASNRNIMSVRNSADTELLVVRGAGNVGIGTTSPSLKLDVSGTGRISSTTYLATNAGNVGIGTTSPSEKLTVEGNISGSGNLYLPDDAEIRGGGSINIYPSTTTGNGRIQIGQFDTIFYSTIRTRAVMPEVNLSYDLGTSSRRWSNIYGAGLDISGSTSFDGDLVVTGSLTVSGSGSFTDSLSVPNIYLENSIYHTGDTNTSFRFDNDQVRIFAANYTAFETTGYNGVIKLGSTGNPQDIYLQNDAGVGLFLQKTTGNVGIGTTTPSQKLEVRDGNLVVSASQPQLILDPSNSFGHNFTILATGANTVFSGSATTYFRNKFGTDVVEMSMSNLLPRVTFDANVNIERGLTVTGSINHDGDLTVTGTVTAQEFKTEFVSASIIYQSGSTKFGDTADDRHSFTGSLQVSGGIYVSDTSGTPRVALEAFDNNEVALKANRWEAPDGNLAVQNNAGELTLVNDSLEGVISGNGKLILKGNNGNYNPSITLTSSNGGSTIRSSGYTAKNTLIQRDWTPGSGSNNFTVRTLELSDNLAFTGSTSYQAIYINPSDNIVEGGMTSVEALRAVTGSVILESGDLQVTGSAKFTEDVLIGQFSNSTSKLRFANITNEGNSAYIGRSTSAQFEINPGSVDEFRIQVPAGADTNPLRFHGQGGLPVAQFYRNQRIRIGGNLSTNPASTLEVIGDTTLSGSLVVSGSSGSSSILTTNGSYYGSYNSSGTAVGLLQLTNSNNTVLRAQSGNNVAIQTAGGNSLWVGSDQNIGIGTITPSSKLHIVAPAFTTGDTYSGLYLSIDSSNTGKGNYGPGIIFGGTAVGNTGINQDGAAIFGLQATDDVDNVGLGFALRPNINNTNRSPAAVLIGTGSSGADTRFGIATVNPDYTLDVNGDAQVRGKIYTDDGLENSYLRYGQVNSIQGNGDWTVILFPVSGSDPDPGDQNYADGTYYIRRSTSLLAATSIDVHINTNDFGSAVGYLNVNNVQDDEFEVTAVTIQTGSAWYAGIRISGSDIPYGNAFYNGIINNSDNNAFTVKDNTDADVTIVDTISSFGADNSGTAIQAISQADESLFKTVGIGTTTPTEALTVEGNISASGDLYLDGAIFDSNDTSGSVGQILTSIAGGTAWENVDTAVLDEVQNIYATVKNTSGTTLYKGTPVHAVSGSSSGNVNPVIAASASVASTMPATFILNEDLADEAEGQAIIAGRITQVDTSTFEVGDVVYVGESGGYTNVKPTGSGNLIQNLGVVTKVHASNGSGVIYGSGRSNDVPNLPVGKIWVGSDNYSVTSSVVHLDETNGRLGINAPTPGNRITVHDTSQNYPLRVGNNTSNVDGSWTGIAFKNSTNTGGGPTYEDSAIRAYRYATGHELELRVNSTASLRIDGDSNVGIGNTSPTEKLTVEGNVSASGVFYASNGSQSAPAYTFADDPDTGIFRHSPNQLELVAGGSTGIRFGTNAVNIYYGSSTKLATTSTGIDVKGGAKISGSVDISGSLTIDTPSTLPLVFKRGGTENGRIFQGGGDLYIGTGDTNIRFNDNIDALVPANSNQSDRNNAISLGSAASRFSNAYLAGLDVSGSGNFTDGLTVTGSVKFLDSDSLLTIEDGGTLLTDIKSNYNQLNFRPNGNQALVLNLAGHTSVKNTLSVGKVLGPSSAADYQLDVSGSGRFTDGLTVTGSINHDGDLTVTGTVTAQEFKTEFVSASIIYQSGSTKFGDTDDDTHSFTGSLELSGSDLRVDGGRLAFKTSAGDYSNYIQNDGGYGMEYYVRSTNRPHEFLNTEDTGKGIRIIPFDSTITNKARIEVTGGVKGEIQGFNEFDAQASGLLFRSDRYNNQVAFHFTGSARNTQDTDKFLVLEDAGTELMTVLNSGNVGIGTTTPGHKLDVAGDIGVGQNDGFYVNNTNVGIERNANDLVLGGYGGIRFKSSATNVTNQTERMRLTSAGDFGIGTDSPDERLHVSGNILVDNGSASALHSSVGVTTTTAGSFTIYSVPTGSYDGAFFDYTIKSGSNGRAGSIQAMWMGSEVNFNETVTTDFGDTSGLDLDVSISGGNMVLTGSCDGADWNIKAVVRAI